MILKYLAQGIHIGGCPTPIPGGSGNSPTPCPDTYITGPLQLPGVTDPNLSDVINRVMVFLIPLAAIILFLVLVWGGFDFLFSQGDPAKIKSAWGKITTAIIGFILLLSSFLIVKLLSSIFGIGEGLF